MSEIIVLLVKDGITVETVSPAEVARYKSLGYVEVGSPPAKKVVEIATPRTEAAQKSAAKEGV